MSQQKEKDTRKRRAGKPGIDPASGVRGIDPDTDIFESIKMSASNEFTQGKELMSREGEDTELMTKTRMTHEMVPAYARVTARINKMITDQYYCGLCGKLGHRTMEDDRTTYKCDTCHIEWQPYYYDHLSMAIIEYFVARISLDGLQRTEFIEREKAMLERLQIKRLSQPNDMQNMGPVS
jgi:hypothetical protein